MPCSVDGLVCKNSDNPQGCDDYQVSYKCKAGCNYIDFAINYDSNGNACPEGWTCTGDAHAHSCTTLGVSNSMAENCGGTGYFSVGGTRTEMLFLNQILLSINLSWLIITSVVKYVKMSHDTAPSR